MREVRCARQRAPSTNAARCFAVTPPRVKYTRLGPWPSLVVVSLPQFDARLVSARLRNHCSAVLLARLAVERFLGAVLLVLTRILTESHRRSGLPGTPVDDRRALGRAAEGWQERGSATKVYTFRHDFVDHLTSAVPTDTNSTPTILKRQTWTYAAAAVDAVFNSTYDNRIVSVCAGQVAMTSCGFAGRRCHGDDRRQAGAGRGRQLPRLRLVGCDDLMGRERLSGMPELPLHRAENRHDRRTGVRWPFGVATAAIVRH